MKNPRTIIFALVLLASPVWPGVSAQPRLAIVGGDTVNFGKHYVGEAHKSIILRNVGTDTIRIVRVVPDSLCISPHITRRVIPPNDSAKLEIWMDHGGFIGKHQNSLSIFSNSISNDTMRIQLIEEIKGRLTVSKRETNFPDCKLNKPVLPEFVLTNYDDTFVTVNAVVLDTDSNSGSLKTEDSRPFILSPGTSHVLHFIYAPLEVGYVVRNITVLTDSPHAPRLVVPISFNVVDNSIHR